MDEYIQTKRGRSSNNNLAESVKAIKTPSK